jgi:hypothetical protein
MGIKRKKTVMPEETEKSHGNRSQAVMSVDRDLNARLYENLAVLLITQPRYSVQL